VIQMPTQPIKDIKVEYPYTCYMCTKPLQTDKIAFPVVDIHSGEPVMRLACLDCYNDLMKKLDGYSTKKK